jgi:hypothetical protein
MDEGLGGYWKDHVSVLDERECLDDDGREVVYDLRDWWQLTSVRSVEDSGLVQILHWSLRSPHRRWHISRHIPGKRRTHGC